MRSSNKWVIEVVTVALILTGLGQAVSYGLNALSPKNPPGALDQILITLYLLAIGLVVEVIRWARESVEQASENVKDVLADQLTNSAEKAVRGAILRSIFPSGNPDPVNARIHFGIVEEYLRQVEAWPPLIQRASGIVAKRHLAAWNAEMATLNSSAGVVIRMDEAARISSVMIQGGTRYINVERVPCDPAQSWSAGFLKVIDDMGQQRTLQKKFILLADPQNLWGEQLQAEKREEARDLFAREAEYLGRRGFEIFFCDERTVYREFGAGSLPGGNFEIFSGQIILRMDESEIYDRALTTQVRSLLDVGELRRLVEIVEEQAKKATARSIKANRFA